MSFFQFLVFFLDLHKWVLDSWSTLVASKIELFPCAKGFFITIFVSIEDCYLVLGRLWTWVEHSLLLKPWTSSFNPLSTTQ